MAVSGLYGMPCVSVHCSADHDRSLLFGEDSRAVSQLADGAARNLDGNHHLDHTCAIVFHQHLRLGAFYWLQRSTSGPVRRTVPQRSGIQYRVDNRILLDDVDRSVHPLWRYIQNRL